MTRWAGVMLMVVLALGSAALCDAPVEIAGQSPRAMPGAGDAHEQLERILSRPLFQRWSLRQMRGEEEKAKDEAAESRFSKYLDSALEWMGEKIRAFFKWVGSLFTRGGTTPSAPSTGSGGGSGMADFVATMMQMMKVLAWVVGAGAVIFLCYVAWRAWEERHRGRRPGRVLSREQVHDALVEGEALAMESPQWLAEAARLAEEGQFRAVYRALYLALLSGLHEAGRIEFRRTRTNWTYVRRFKGEEADRASFSELTWMFDEAWYGLRPPPNADLGKLRRQVAQLVGEVPHGK